MREWGALSSCHGVPHMAEASSHLALLIWTLILVASFVTFAILFSDTLIQYLKYEKLVVLEVTKFIWAHSDMTFSKNFPANTTT